MGKKAKAKKGKGKATSHPQSTPDKDMKGPTRANFETKYSRKSLVKAANKLNLGTAHQRQLFKEILTEKKPNGVLIHFLLYKVFWPKISARDMRILMDEADK